MGAHTRRLIGFRPRRRSSRVLGPDLDALSGCAALARSTAARSPLCPSCCPASVAWGWADPERLRGLAGVAPVTRCSGKRRVVVMRRACQLRLRTAVQFGGRVSGWIPVQVAVVADPVPVLQDRVDYAGDAAP